MSSLSIGMPNYNDAHYIAESLEAILNQSYPFKEIVIIENASTDDSLSIIKSFTERDSRIKLICNTENIGPVLSVKKILEVTSGDYISLIAADDPIRPGLYEKAMNLLARYSHSGFCCSEYTRIYPDGKTEELRIDLRDSPGFLTPDELVHVLKRRGRLSITTNTCIYSRTALLESGLTEPEVMKLRWHFDWFVSLVIAFRYGICYIPESLQMVRIDPNSYCQSGMRNRNAQREVIEQILVLLNSEKYADIQHYFKIPSVLSKFGFKLLDIIVKNPKYWHYLSLDLIQSAIKYGEGYKFNISFTMSGKENIDDVVSICCKSLRVFADSFKKQGDYFRDLGDIPKALQFYSKALDADPEFLEVHSVLHEINKISQAGPRRFPGRLEL